jgi:hypothetical protein
MMRSSTRSALFVGMVSSVLLSSGVLARAQTPPGAATRSAVIAGRITDERGTPVVNSPIVILHDRVLGGEHVLRAVQASSITTNADGEYRAYGLPAGTYVVGAYKPGNYMWFPGMNRGPVRSIDTRSGADSAVAGLRAPTAAEISAAMAEIAASAPAGAAVMPSVREQARPADYGMTFYPGTGRFAAARAVTVGAGEERTGIDFPIIRQPLATISGRVVDVDGTPPSGAMLIFSDGDSSGSASLAADGSFLRANVMPGRRTITVLAPRLNPRQYATSEVTVTGEDVTDLTLTMRECLTMSGRVVFEGRSGAAPPILTGARVNLVARNRIGMIQLPRPNVAADGTFSATGIIPGVYDISVVLAGAAPGQPSAWQIRSVTWHGREMAGLPFVVDDNSDLSDIVVTYTDQVSELSGTLVDARGQPAVGSYVAAFATDPRYWRDGARRLPAPIAVDEHGAFRFRGLPAGTYYLAALAEVADPQEAYDDELLTRLARSALTVTMREGEATVQDLVAR